MKKSIVKHYGICSDKITDDILRMRIVFISDLHNGVFGKDNTILLDKIDELAPDLVLLGGDTIIAKPEHSMENGLQFIKDLSRRHQIYAAHGNHEYRLRIYPEVYGKMYSRYQQQIKDCGVILLENKTANLVIKHNPVAIHGLELDRQYYRRFKKPALTVQKLRNYLGNPADNAFHILLAHNPRYGNTYLKWGADLTLSGHYHGGLIRTPGDLPLLGNDFCLFPAFGYGRHRWRTANLITSAGLGEHTLPLRLHNPRELVVVDVLPAMNNDKR